MGQFAIPRLEKFDVTVVVSGTTGSTLFYATGKIDKIAIAPPANTNPGYGVEIADSSSYGIFGRGGISGKATLKVDAICLKTNTITLSNATIDGTYTVRFWIEYGG